MYKDGVKHGYGEITFANGKFYKGEWLNGKMHGQGVYGNLNDSKILNQQGRKGEWYSGTRVKWLEAVGEVNKSKLDTSQ